MFTTKKILYPLVMLVLVTVAVLFVAAAFAWTGALWTYVTFTAAFFAMLAVGLKKRVSLGYIFLTSTLWIGFWVKTSIHMIDNTFPWMEPTGLFDFSPVAWDQLALLSAVGALAVLCAGLLWKGRVETNWHKGSFIATNRVRLSAWIASLLVIAVTVVVNERFDINHAGVIPPVLDVPWPLQGLFNWFIGAALVMLFAPLYLEMARGRSLVGPIVLVLLAGAAIAISVGSRGTIVFQSATIILVAITYRNQIEWLNWRRIISIIIICVSAIAIVGIVSQMRREAWREGGVGLNETRFVYSSNTLWHVAHLSISRWVGLEGLMAVSAYPEKGTALLMRAISEKGVRGSADMYTSEISTKGIPDAEKHAYVTLPGMFAYWYYSNSWLLMFGMVFILTSFVVYIERTVMKITKNPLFAVSIGVTSALAINMSPGGVFTPAVMTSLNIGVVLVLGLYLRWLTERKKT